MRVDFWRFKFVREHVRTSLNCVEWIV